MEKHFVLLQNVAILLPNTLYKVGSTTTSWRSIDTIYIFNVILVKLSVEL